MPLKIEAQLEKSIEELTDKITHLKNNRDILSDQVNKLTEQVNVSSKSDKRKTRKISVIH